MPLLLPRESDADSITAPTLITSFTSPTPPSFTLPTPSPSSSSSASSSSTDSASENLDSTSQSFTKNVLQWLIVGLAILVLASVIRGRLNTLRRNGLPLTSFFSIHNPDRDRRRRVGSSYPRRNVVSRYGNRPFTSTYSSSLTPYDLANVPLAYNPFASAMYYDPTHSPSRSHNSNHNNTHTRTTTRAADIGQGGRRQGGGPSDYDGEVGDKDELPAYDKYGGPPGYIDSLHLPVLHSASQSSQEREQERDREPAPGYSPEERH